MTPLRTDSPLGDSATRDYARKLQRFNACAAPELRRAIASLDLQAGMRVLDAGCGTGEALQWLLEAVGPTGQVIGVDLAAAHLAAHRAARRPGGAPVLQADLRQPPFAAGSFDLIWCVNTLHHLPAAPAAARALIRLLKPGGRLALGQSSLLPDMVFAWDARLERLTNEAVRSYYRERYGLSETQLTAVRAIAGLLRGAGLGNVQARTFLIERLAPLNAADTAYLAETIFQDTWGAERLRPWLTNEDHAALMELTHEKAAGFALRRPDFHFIQSFTLAIGTAG